MKNLLILRYLLKFFNIDIIVLLLIPILAWSQQLDSISYKSSRTDSIANDIFSNIIKNNIAPELLYESCFRNIELETCELVQIQKEVGKLLFIEGRYSYSGLVFDSILSKFKSKIDIREFFDLLLEACRASLYSNNIAKSKILLDSLLILSTDGNLKKEDLLYFRDVYSEYYIKNKKYKNAKLHQQIADSLACGIGYTNEAYIKHLKFSIYFNTLIRNFNEALKQNSLLLSCFSKYDKSFNEIIYNRGWLYSKLSVFDSSFYYSKIVLSNLSQVLPANSINLIEKKIFHANLLSELKYFEKADSLFNFLDIILYNELKNGLIKDKAGYIELYISNLAKLVQLSEEIGSHELITKHRVYIIDSLLNIFDSTDEIREDIRIWIYDTMLRYFYKAQSKEANKYFEKAYLLYINNLKEAVAELPEIELSQYLINNELGGYNSLFNYYNPKFMDIKFQKTLFNFSLLNKAVGLKTDQLLAGLKLDGYEECKVNLDSNDIAVNFYKYNKIINFKISNREETYIALIVSPKFRNPLIVELCNEFLLDSIIENKELGADINLIQNENRGSVNGLVKRKKDNLEILYKLIWEPIFSKFDSVSSIYYSSTGLLSKINLSILKESKSKYSFESLNYYNYLQLLDFKNRKNLVTKAYERAVIIGGIDYGVNNKSEADSWHELIGSKLEVNKINQILINNSIKSDLITDLNASKETIKDKLKNNEYDLFHISTHGFYSVCNREEFDSFDPLDLVGLVFANANYFGSNREMHNNGILYGGELRNLKLDNIRLAVLSSCQSGSGGLNQNNEGVYGFQWVLKRAGVEKILVGLWDLPDVPTMKILVEFYKNIIIERDESNLALKKAQLKIKKEFPDYYSWAGLILLN